MEAVRRTISDDGSLTFSPELVKQLQVSRCAAVLWRFVLHANLQTGGYRCCVMICETYQLKAPCPTLSLGVLTP